MIIDFVAQTTVMALGMVTDTKCSDDGVTAQMRLIVDSVASSSYHWHTNTLHLAESSIAKNSRKSSDVHNLIVS